MYGYMFRISMRPSSNTHLPKAKVPVALHVHLGARLLSSWPVDSSKIQHGSISRIAALDLFVGFISDVNDSRKRVVISRSKNCPIQAFQNSTNVRLVAQLSRKNLVSETGNQTTNIKKGDSSTSKYP